MFNQKLNNLQRGQQRTMPAKRSMNNGQKAWPGASHEKACKQQCQKPKNQIVQQQRQMDDPTTSSAAIENEAEENSSIDSEVEDVWYTAEEDEVNDENEQMEMEEENFEQWEMLPTANLDEKPEKKPQKFGNLIHTRQLLEGVLCSWEKMQEFIRMRPNDYWKVLTTPSANHFIEEVLVAFNVLGKGKMVYIDQINELGRGTIRFEHYGDIKIDTIQPHCGQINEEDFERWLCKLISREDELPRTNAKLQARRQFLEFFNDLNNSTLISGRVQQNSKMLFHGMVDQIDEPILQPFELDISPIILHPNHFHLLLKFCQPEFRELLIGLYLEVKISEIQAYSMKLPPMLNHMLIPISLVTFDAPKHYKVLHMAKQMMCNVIVHVQNAKGDVICSAMLPREINKNEELVQASVVIWRMNNIALPTFDRVQQKTKQLERAFVLAKEIKFIKESGTLPIPFYGRRVFAELIRQR